MSRGRATRSCLWLVAAALAIVPASAAAERFVPTRFDDPSPGPCKLRDCSLREAIRAAENHGGPDKVVLSRGTYELQIPDTSGAGIEAGDLNLSGKLQLHGLGPKKTTIDGNAVDRVFTADGRIKLIGLTVKGGDASANPGHTDAGGGLLAFAGNVLLKNVVVKKNSAHLGGGVESVADRLTISRSTLYLNRADEGAGLDMRSSITPPVTHLKASTLYLNLATVKGAGALADGHASGPATQVPTFVARNSTIAYNVAVGDPAPNQGGGVMADNEAYVQLDNVTVFGNRAGDVAREGIGGGLYQHSNAILNPGDSIVYANGVGANGMVRTDVDRAQCAGTLNGSGGNLFQQLGGGSCTITGGYTETTDAMLGTLGNHGGPTQTIPLLAGSPAIGLATSCPPKDQRGVARPATGCDSGAYERKGP